MTEKELGDFADAASEPTSVPEQLKLLNLNTGETIILCEMTSAWWTGSLYPMTLGLWAIWRKRHLFILTNQRLINTRGIVSKSERSVLLARIQDVNVSRSIFSGGKVSITSAGGPLSFRFVGPLTRAKAAMFAETLTSLISNQGDGLSSPPNNSLPSVSTADEIKKLVQLRDSGAITEEEFVAHKARLLR